MNFIVWPKWSQCLKNNFIDNLSIPPPPQCIKLFVAQCYFKNVILLYYSYTVLPWSGLPLSAQVSRLQLKCVECDGVRENLGNLLQ